MIFLSHNHKDKKIVEPIAVRLKEAYGEENVFYDSWSIKPGDNIIGKMNTGLEKAKYFFYFISENSLNSKMVDMEWQAALIKMAQQNIKFIPIKIDSSNPPGILLSTLYIDMYTNGFEVGLRQIFDVINNENSKPLITKFSNIRVIVYDGENNDTIIQIESVYFYEPSTRFMLCYNNLNEEIEFKLMTDSLYNYKEIENLKLNNGLTVNGRCFDIMRGLEPGFPARVIIKHKNAGQIKDLILMRATKENYFESISIIQKKVIR